MTSQILEILFERFFQSTRHKGSVISKILSMICFNVWLIIGQMLSMSLFQRWPTTKRGQSRHLSFLVQRRQLEITQSKRSDWLRGKSRDGSSTNHLGGETQPWEYCVNLICKNCQLLQFIALFYIISSTNWRRWSAESPPHQDLGSFPVISNLLS